VRETLRRVPEKSGDTTSFDSGHVRSLLKTEGHGASPRTVQFLLLRGLALYDVVFGSDLI
jgi:hypothetical protein